MWIPTNSIELESLINAGNLEESSTLDFKVELPSSSKELAKDVAAMANDGGILVFGIGEDSSGRPTILQPFALAGAADRVSSMVRSSLSEPPLIDIRTLPKEQNPEVGYLAAIVPASPRAPHMVVVKGDNRFYGRTATGNAVLTEGEVARLYERRQRWELDREKHLEQVVEDMKLEPQGHLGYLFLYARPVAPSPDRLAELGDRDVQRSKIHQFIIEASRGSVYPHVFSPAFNAGLFKPIASGWRVFMAGEQVDPQNTLVLEVHFNCEVRLFLGRATDLYRERLVLFESGLAETTLRFFALVAQLLESVHYFGPLDVGLAVTGIKGATAHGALHGHAGYLTHFDQHSFRETLRALSIQLQQDPRGVARSLLSRLFHASGAVGNFDPLMESS